jgi:hypothetical protein
VTSGAGSHGVRRRDGGRRTARVGTERLRERSRAADRWCWQPARGSLGEGGASRPIYTNPIPAVSNVCRGSM